MDSEAAVSEENEPGIEPPETAEATVSEPPSLPRYYVCMLEEL